MMKIRLHSLAIFLLISTALAGGAPHEAVRGGAGAEAKQPLYGLWLHPGDVGHNEAEVGAFMEKAHDAHINTIVLLVKSAGALYYASKLVPDAIAADYRNFDVLRATITEAHKRGMKVHAWLCDFTEGADGYAFKHHPEWAALNPDGNTTASETLGPNRPYRDVWMCPARRPGYTDQYLLPLIREIATEYAVDGIHHDYVRYPGDVNPDGYCFCDYCLEHVFTHSHLAYEMEPHQAPVERFLPRLDADLSRDYTPKPPHWDEWTRREKANFLLYGRYSYDSAPDMSYYFYTYRTDAIRDFARAAYELVKSVRSSMVISAAVFKNPETSGRFIGQRWTDWTQFVDELMPMTYRSHFSVDWPTFLKQFGEYTRYQKAWADKSEFDQGIATWYLYREMYDPVNQMNAAIDRWMASPSSEGAQRAEILRLAQTTLAQLPEGSRKSEFARALADLPQAIDSEAARKTVLVLRHINERLLSDPPPDFMLPQRLLDAIRVARENGADGIVLFAGGSVERQHLWGAVKEAFGK
jgi:uncharacterized lipoprotein YddW (UPF0748 family)